MLIKKELLVQEINRLKEENNCLKLKIRDLEDSSKSKKIEFQKKINGLYRVIENQKKKNSELFSIFEEIKIN